MHGLNHSSAVCRGVRLDEDRRTIRIVSWSSKQTHYPSPVASVNSARPETAEPQRSLRIRGHDEPRARRGRRGSQSPHDPPTSWNLREISLQLMPPYFVPQNSTRRTNKRVVSELAPLMRDGQYHMSSIILGRLHGRQATQVGPCSTHLGIVRMPSNRRPREPTRPLCVAAARGEGIRRRNMGPVKFCCRKSLQRVKRSSATAAASGRSDRGA
ncbi:uncharacterized protein LY79DRAFT_571347 [Colletotrichum navitas]|uniref:Uncharacterized protein n=1 Tax=Colletotrichum navitas TaxID=681940 RepID=A0AAD8PLX8_9PEZI|nr:uncharacterized protein LY79DRAFT_571347 [Colletotrichum navitas]KAK1569754.1 hypothetical protein LY79DRAFT_571347 [Colletotrichum navitas]